MEGMGGHGRTWEGHGKGGMFFLRSTYWAHMSWGWRRALSFGSHEISVSQEGKGGKGGKKEGAKKGAKGNLEC